MKNFLPSQLTASWV